MSRPRKPWWSITRTRRQSLVLGILWLAVGALQVSTLLAEERATWWRWALMALLFALAVCYLSAWWVRGRRERVASGTDSRR